MREFFSIWDRVLHKRVFCFEMKEFANIQQRQQWMPVNIK